MSFFVLVRHEGLEPPTFASPRTFFPLQAATMLAEIHPLKFQHLQDFYLLFSFIIFYWFLAFVKNFGGKKEGNRKRPTRKSKPPIQSTYISPAHRKHTHYAIYFDLKNYKKFEKPISLKYLYDVRSPEVK